MKKADLLLQGGAIVDVVEKRCYAGDILIKDGLIHSIAPTPSAAEALETRDIAGQYVIPGFIDPHLHIESSLLNPLEFAQAVVRHGTTAVFVDPHEIANVAGRDGIDLSCATLKLPPSTSSSVCPRVSPPPHSKIPELRLPSPTSRSFSLIRRSTGSRR